MNKNLPSKKSAVVGGRRGLEGRFYNNVISYSGIQLHLMRKANTTMADVKDKTAIKYVSGEMNVLVACLLPITTQKNLALT